MNKPITLQFTFKNHLRIDQVIKISQLAKSYNGSIYLVTRNKSVINAENFTTFITYLLTVKNGQEITFIINGEYSHLKLNDLKKIISSEAKLAKKPMLQPAMKANME
ncbi:hypothetical protein [Metabacillus halosaccharovorans]|uniref:HPr domain-containing protein n=1 Tax=Metabacillus halosaccharovorans TaxID=930124 RepID=A0ABT3DJW8_9BACI|nr:hypothetical protein [Metabacillus halosaccharovorans]MCV9887214.1 hypothetical protein [Metabacillus halosaccharovorans]